MNWEKRSGKNCLVILLGIMLELEWTGQSCHVVVVILSWEILIKTDSMKYGMVPPSVPFGERSSKTMAWIL
jgi:hypothetical protein